VLQQSSSTAGVITVTRNMLQHTSNPTIEVADCYGAAVVFCCCWPHLSTAASAPKLAALLKAVVNVHTQLPAIQNVTE
jgi:hypothetical protein